VPLKNKTRKKEKIRVVVKSKRVPVAINYVQEIRWTTLGTFTVQRPTLQYQDRLEDEDLATLEYAKQVASFANISLEVIDLSKTNYLLRMVRSLITKNPQTPSIVLPGAVLATVLGFPTGITSAKPDGLNALAISRPGQKG
jgi:hypothetical protein